MGYSGVTLGLLWVTFKVLGDIFYLSKMTLDDLASTLEQVLVYESSLSKTPIFPMNFNDFMKLWGMIGVTWGHFGVTLGSLWGYFEATWRHLGSFGGPLGARWDIFGGLLVS